MNKKLLIAPNSFKEVADSDKVADLFNKYLKDNTSISIYTLPISDGGDGFLNVCKSVFNLEILEYEITTPFDETTFVCSVGYDRKGKKIFVESARVLGLKVIPEEKREPLKLSSKGIGDLFLRIIDDVKLNKILVDEIIIGVGGTGTNDLGLGVCSRFGMEFYDIFGKKDKIIPEYFYRIKDIGWNNQPLPFRIATVIDVKNPLLGRKGAARTFASQKGADKGEIEVLELGFTKVINILKDKKIKRSLDDLSGAGGGLAAGLHIFFNASEISASEFILKYLHLEEIVSDNDMILTGEGSFDEQSLEGKGAGIVLNLATRFKKRVILCCGIVEEKVKEKLGDNVEVIELTSFFDSRIDSIKNFEKGIESACTKINLMF
jgi:glycerate kinase